MDYRYKHLEQELAALSKVFSDLGIRLSEVAKEVASQGVMPSEKLLEQISASRTSFESCRNAIHTHAGAMLVSPLPKIGELVSVAAIDSLLKASAVAEQNKISIETEREKALAILGRVLAITHRETNEFKPLQDCQVKLAELRSGISSVPWPHRHPESEKVVAGQHPALSLLSFVESVDSLDDERWMALETTITETYGKPLFVAASRGKLTVGEEPKGPVQPVAGKAPVGAPAPAKAPVVAPPEAPKPPAVAEKPVEKKIVAERAPEKPAAPAPAATPVVTHAVSVEKKVAPPPAPVAPATAAPVQAVAVERKEAAQDRTPQKPAAPPVAAVPTPVIAVPVAPVVSIEKKESSEKPHPVAAPTVSAPAASATPAVTQIPMPPQAAATVVSVPHAVVAPSPSPAAVPAHPAPAATVSSVPVTASAPAPPRPQAPAPVAAQTAPAPAPVAPVPAPSAAQPVVSNSHATSAPQHAAATSLSALANATESSSDKRSSATVPVEAIDRRKEPRLAAPAPQPVGRTESNGEEFTGEEGEKAVAGDASQRPQRWGFWRGNRT